MKENLILPTTYFPSIAWMAAVCDRDEVLVDASEHYTKRSLRNKTIINHGGKEVLLTVPIRHDQASKLIIDIPIAYDENWEKDHLGALQACFGKAPYYIHYIDDMTTLIQSGEKKIFDLNLRIMHELFKILALDIEVKVQKQFIQRSTEEYRVLRDAIKYTGPYSTFEKKVEVQMSRELRWTRLPRSMGSRSSVLNLLFHLGPETSPFVKRLL